MRSAPLVAAAILFAGCSSGDKTPDALVRCPLGDPNGPAQLEIYHQDRNFASVKTTAGAQVPLIAPPQGGWIVLLGARATNLDGCHVNLTVSFREACGGPVIQVDRRPTRIDDTGDGWGMTNTSAFGNLPICPEVSAAHDLHDQPYEVTVTLEDLDGKKASKSIVIEPICPDPDPAGLCLCQCDHNYVLGGACPPGGADAGVSSCDAGM
jgi:hypothetical protein